MKYRITNMKLEHMNTLTPKHTRKQILKYTLIIILSLWAYAFSFAQSGWFWQKPLPQGNNLYAVDFVNENYGFAVGSKGTIIKTTNGGADWNLLAHNFDEDLQTVDFYSQVKGIAAGKNGMLITTEDGGITWVQQSSNTVLSINKMQFLSDSVLLAVCDSGKILKSYNAGQSWIMINSSINEKLNSICFINNSIGFVSGLNGTILKTNDSGETWSVLTSGVLSGIQALFFINDNIGFITYGNVVKKTSDGGNTWQTYGILSDNYLYSMYFFNEDWGVITGQYGISLTTDGGITWQYQHYGFLQHIYFAPTNIGYAVGYNGVIIKSFDWGQSWIPLTSGNELGNNYSAFFLNKTTGFVSGGNAVFTLKNQKNNETYGKVLKTTNSGLTWTQCAIPTENVLNSIFFTTDNNGYAVGQYGTYIRTTNGGNSWTLQTFNNNFLEDIFFPSQNIGYIAGIDGVIYKTTNGGDNWTTLSTGTSSAVFKIFFLNENNGFLIGSSGLLMKTENGGNSWQTINTSVQNHLRAIHFVDNQTGYISGQNGTILKTIDGGNTWSNISFTNSNFYSSVYFTSVDTGYVSMDNKFFKTLNGGQTWTIENFNFPNIQDIVFADKNHGWVIGGNGIVATNTASSEIGSSSNKLIDITDISVGSKCQLPYTSKITVSSEITGFSVGDTVQYQIDFGDGTTNIYNDILSQNAGYVYYTVEHVYNSGGAYNLKCISTVNHLFNDTLQCNSPIQLSDTCGEIAGCVFKDNNNNCLFDNGDFKLNNIPVLLYNSSDQFVAMQFTDNNGVYSFDIPDNTQYKVYVDSLYSNGYSINCNSEYQISSFPSYNNDFSYLCGNNGFDLYGTMECSGFMLQTGSILYMGIFNNSCNAVNTTATLILPSYVSYQYALPFEPVINGDTLTWSIGNINDSSYTMFYVYLYLNNDTSAFNTGNVCMNLQVTPETGDFNTSNNNLYRCFPIYTSFDPNMKTVSPADTLGDNDTELSYSVFFQNTGSAPAVNIYIIDTLDQNLDPASFRVNSYSHPMSVSVLNYNPFIVKFKFYNIMLPDSNSNESLSHGFVSYTINRKTDLFPETKIKNTAHIYFDYNPPISTNTTENIYKITGVKYLNSDFGYLIYPNPATDELYIEFSNLQPQTSSLRQYKIYGIEGKKVKEGKLEGSKTRISTKDLESGVYFVKVISDELSLSKHDKPEVVSKLVITK